MTLRVPFLDAMDYGPFLDRVEPQFREILGDEAELTVTGLMGLMGRIFVALIESMIRSYILAFILIAGMMMLLLGSFRVGLISMIPNLTPILFTLGFMGFSGLKLDLFTLLIGSIALGLAVDDTIHFMHNFRRYSDETGDVRQSVSKTLETTGQAMLFTSIVLSFCLPACNRPSS